MQTSVFTKRSRQMVVNVSAWGAERTGKRVTIMSILRLVLGFVIASCLDAAPPPAQSQSHTPKQTRVQARALPAPLRLQPDARAPEPFNAGLFNAPPPLPSPASFFEMLFGGGRSNMQDNHPTYGPHYASLG